MEYTYGYDVYKETFLERMERAKGEEYDDKGYIIEKNPAALDVNENHSHLRKLTLKPASK